MSLKVLVKTVTFGEKTFKVGVDRNLAIACLEEKPELMEYLISQRNTSAKSSQEFFLKALKEKTLGKLYAMEDKLSELTELSLPLMLKKAEDDHDAKEIIDYAKEHDAMGTLNNGMLEFLMQGFSQRELAKPTIKFSMK